LIAAVLTAVCLLAATAEPPPVRGNGEAERLFQQGLKAYDAGELARALEAFEAAHRLTPMPEILFDIGMTYRALGDCRRAVKAFDDFIHAVPPGDPLLARARDRRAELGSCAASATGDAAAASAASTAPAGAPLELRAVPAIEAQAAPPAALHVGAQPTTSGGRSRRWRDACGVSLGSTGVLTVAGLVFGWQAHAAQQDVQNAKVWDDDTARADQRGRTLGEASVGLLLSAAATAVVAATTCVVARGQN
jgi:hypothetical protein